MKIRGVYILSRRSVLRLIATITAALVALYSAATAQAESTIRRIHDATISLVSLDRQMTGRLVRTAEGRATVRVQAHATLEARRVSTAL